MSHYRPRDGKDGIPGTHGKDGRDGEQGPIGPMPEHEWIGTSLRFQEPDGEWGDFVDLEGPKGEDGKDGRDGTDGKDGRDGRDGADGERGPRGSSGTDGEDGAMGPMPDHQWQGTRLRFEEPNGDWGKFVDLKGDKGDRGSPGGSGAPGPQGPKGDPGSVGNLEADPGIHLETDSSGVITIGFDADTAQIASLPGATYTTLQEFLNVMHSPGLVKGGEFTDAGSGNLSVAGGTVAIRDVDDDVSRLYMADFPAVVVAIPSDSVTRFIGVERNGSSPQVVVKTSDTWDMDTDFPLGTAANLGGVLFPFYNPFKVGDPLTNIIQRFDAQATIIRAASGGIILGNTGTRQATLTSGVTWARLNDYPITAKNSGTQTLIGVRPNPAAPPPLVFDLGLTQWPNTQYLSGTTLTTMTNNRWAVLWFFVNIGTNAWGFAYGTDEYNNSAQASQEGIPSYLTANFLANNLLVGRMLFEKSSDTPIVESAFTRAFSTQPVSDHNQLSTLQGGTTSEYYHLTGDEHSFLVTVSSESSFDERAQDAVGSILTDSSTVRFDYDDVSNTISAEAPPLIFGQEYLAAFHNKLLSETPALMTFSGDSTTFGTNITDPNYILSTAVLRIGLNRRHALTAANAGHSGASTEDWRTLYLAGDLATNPDLYILRWGLNDPFWGRSLADFEQSLRDGLATARASKPIEDMSILLMVPNTANDTANGRDAAWMEATRPIIRQAARDYQCAFIDTFKLWEDTENAANLWMDEPLGPGVVIHPLNVMNSWISSKIGELIYPDALDPVKTEVRATLSTSQSFSTGAFSTIVFDTVSMDARGEYDASTGEFTCTQTGKYLVNAQASIDFSTDDRVVIGSILVNSSEVVRLSSITFYGSVASSAGQAGGTAIIDLVAGDVVTFNTFVFIISGGTTYTVDNFPFSTLLKISRME